MDKLKLSLAALRRHYFWVLCGVIVIVSVTTWEMASRDLQARYKENYSKINSTFVQLNEFNGESPNEKYKTGLEGERTKLNGLVMAAWNEFNKQQKDKLVWPERVAVVNQLAPNAEIPESIRENFVTNVVKPNLQRIFEVVNIRRPKGEANNQDIVLPGMGRNAAQEFEGIVHWDLSKREDLEKRFRMNEIPSTIWVRAKMEDMWIYESLVNIIAKINEGATDSLNASIKRIERIDLAQWAIYNAQKNPGADLKLKKADAGMGGPTSSSGTDDGFVHIPGVGEQKMHPDLALLEGRYIDENNSPVPVEAVIAEFIDPQSPEGKVSMRPLEQIQPPRPLKEPPFTEFRQVFVDMQFLMDQRKIPDLMAACANSPLPIEIRQVVMSFFDVDTVKSTEGQAAVQPGAEVAMPGQTERAPYDATVQLRGIVYIYDQPQDAKLGKGSAPKPAQRKLGTPQQKKAEEAQLAPMEPQFN